MAELQSEIQTLEMQRPQMYIKGVINDTNKVSILNKI